MWRSDMPISEFSKLLNEAYFEHKKFQHGDRMRLDSYYFEI
jgi:hypothetical protein